MHNSQLHRYVTQIYECIGVRVVTWKPGNIFTSRNVYKKKNEGDLYACASRGCCDASLQLHDLMGQPQLNEANLSDPFNES